jgi:anhydro-N-acetylmuramic acid kinase
MTPRAKAAGEQLTVAGMMSGTSADGIDVAIVRISPNDGGLPRLRLLHHAAHPFAPALRAHVLDAMNAASISVADLARLQTRLGVAYADTLEKTLQMSKLRLDLTGCHGQTFYHQATAKKFLGRNIATTWQALDPAPITERLHIPVVSDFRPADVAAGGQGAPLVPLLDYTFFRHAKRNRVLQNLGGIGNMTILPANAKLDQVIAFDTGPANMVIDALMLELYDRPFDRNGTIAAAGRVLDAVITPILRSAFFRKPPPKTAGREQFGREFAREFLATCRRHSRRKEDAVATATMLTARSLRIAIENFVVPKFAEQPFELVLSGGGSRNRTLIAMLHAELAQVPCHILTSDDLGLPSAAKEAVAFALLAWQTWHGLPGNVPSATGARRSVVLGRVSYA